MRKPSPMQKGERTMNNKMQKMYSLFLTSVLILGSSAAAFAQNTPGYNNEIPDNILKAQELSPREQMIHRRAVEAAVWGMPIEGTRGLVSVHFKNSISPINTKC